jgi:hypothetical protein
MLNSDVTQTNLHDICDNRLKDGTRAEIIIIIIIIIFIDT